MRRLVLIAFVVVLALCLPACSGGHATKAGRNAHLTLRLASLEGEHSPAAPGLQDFATRVSALSHGSMNVQIVWHAPDKVFGSYGPHAEQQVAGLVQNGRFDLSLIPSRAWEALGVTSFRALQAPFLVDSDALLDEVTQRLATPMLEGLNGTGVVGLGLFRQGLRHPIGFRRPFLRLSDFQGARMRTPYSETSAGLMMALGVTPDMGSNAFSGDAHSGRTGGAESAFAYGTDLPLLGTFTANITFYSRADTLIVNQKALEALSSVQAAVLRDAAGGTAARLAETHQSERSAAADYCTRGGGVAIAKGSDVRQLTVAAASVYRALEEDPQTKDLIEQIQRLKAATAPDRTPNVCKLGSEHS